MKLKIADILQKYKLAAILLGLVLIVSGTILNESYETELRNGALIFLSFSLGVTIIVYSIFKLKYGYIPLIAITGGLLFLFISIEIMNKVESLMINKYKSEISGKIISEFYSRPVKGTEDSWNYSYEFKINDKVYRKRSRFKYDKYSKNDQVNVEYCNKYPFFSRIKNEYVQYDRYRP